MEKRRRAKRRFPGLGVLATAAIAALSPAQDDKRPQAPPGWEPKPVIHSPSGVGFFLPLRFRQLPASKHRPRAFQGRLGGAPVRVHLNVGTAGRFATVSRSLLAMTTGSTIVRVSAYRLLAKEKQKDRGQMWDETEPAVIVDRRTLKPERRILEAVVCPRRRAVSLELQFLANVGGHALAQGERLLRTLYLTLPGGFTVATGGPKQLIAKEIARGFDTPVRDKIEIVRSAHYRLYTRSGSGDKLLALLEDRLFPIIEDLTGPVPPQFDEFNRLPIFLHRTKEDYEQAALRLGIPQEMAQSMEGYAFDQYYSTTYTDPGDSIHIHEGTHQYLTAVLGLDGGGPWFQEGLAQWIESMYSRRDPRRNTRNLLRNRKDSFPDLRTLVGARTLLRPLRPKGDGLRGQERYDIAASLVRYLAQEHHNDFKDLLFRVGVLPRGQPRLVQDAFRSSVRRDLEEIEKGWHRWLLSNG